MADAKADKTDKVSPAQYLQQVRQEGRKVEWPTWRETYVTTIQVMIFTVIMGAFFFVVDFGVGNFVNYILGIGG